jgi:hypothetical protein
MRQACIAVFALLALARALPAVVAEERQPETMPELCWHNNYADAVNVAKREKKMLLVYFSQRRLDAAHQAFARQTLGDPRVARELARNYVLCRVVDREKILFARRRAALLDHPAFAEMNQQPGIAVLDFAHPKADFYEQVVSALPFSDGKFYNADAMLVVLGLPAGSLTQRTMIYVVRTHPAKPQSTLGEFHPVLAEQAKKHSTRMASMRNQGHHNWGSRAQQISYQIGDMPQEIVAESWPGETLLEACRDCVDSWRQSSGHWRQVRSRHGIFGYDIQKGQNGIWYATGIFAR